MCMCTSAGSFSLTAASNNGRQKSKKKKRPTDSELHLQPLYKLLMLQAHVRHAAVVWVNIVQSAFTLICGQVVLIFTGVRKAALTSELVTKPLYHLVRLDAADLSGSYDQGVLIAAHENVFCYYPLRTLVQAQAD